MFYYMYIDSFQTILKVYLLFHKFKVLFQTVSKALNTVADPGISKRGGEVLFRSGVCFDAPSHIPYVFVAIVVDKIHTVNIVY